MITLSARVQAHRVTNSGVTVAHVFQMEDLAEEFAHIIPFFKPCQDALDALDYIDLLHDHLLDYFVAVEDLDSTGKVSERIKNFVFTDSELDKV